MKANKIMEMADEYLGADNRKRKEKIKYLKEVLKKLRKREKKLELKFAEDDSNKEKISNELALIHAHRKKGLDLLQQLEKERKESKLAKKSAKLEAQIEQTEQDIKKPL